MIGTQDKTSGELSLLVHDRDVDHGIRGDRAVPDQK